MLKIFAGFVAALTLSAACTSTNAVSLTYAAPAGLQRVQAAGIATVNVTDQRGNDPKWIGAIRGGYGNPLKVLTTEQPVKDVVARLVTEGLAARGLSSTGAPYRLDIVLKAFNASQYARREAHVEMVATVVNASTNATVFTRPVRADEVNGSVLALNTGIMANPEELRAIANQALQAAIDDLLNDPALHAALR
jgi:hypothetical protein